MGHLSPNHQWDMHRHSLSLLTPAQARGTSINPRVRHKHRLFRRQAREAKAWVEVGYRAHRPGPRGPKGVSTPLHFRLILFLLSCLWARVLFDFVAYACDCVC